MNKPEKSIWQLVAAALLSGAVASTVVGTMFTRYVTEIEEDIRSRREWKEQSVAALLGPMNIQFARTKRAFDRWTEKNVYLEAKVIKMGNETIRDLLLERGHLIPPELLEDAANLIEHYDVWLEIFEKQRGRKEPDLKSEFRKSDFVFAAPEGFGFPSESEMRFRRKYEAYWDELYGNR